MLDYTDKIKESDELRKLGLQSKLNIILKDFLKNSYEIVFSIHDAEVSNMFSICLMQILQLDMCEDEDEDMDITKLAYYNMTNVVEACENQELQIEALRLRVLLLASFGENLNDSLVTIFYKDKDYSTAEYMAQRNICDDYIKKMQVSDIYTIDDISEGSYKDGLLSDISNALEEDISFDNEEIKKAELLHKVLYAYIKARYKK